jgi:hypothetical protein
MYSIGSLIPGSYKLEVEKVGFKTIIKPDLILHVQDVASMNFEMAIGAVSESITVQAGTSLVDTTDASVSTVIDRNFAENLPMNGRSFQTLIQLTPGVVLTPSNGSDNGQFSINGQRAASNYWMVDGVGANIGISGLFGGTLGNGLGGAVGSFSALGGTNSLVSVDALQEFRIQTSTYAPEFGRTPGGQISIVTRSGTDQFHGSAFDYLRNGLLDANNWFADAENLPKPQERQNDFGGTFSGPILRNKTFFFFSYEGLRLRLPETTLTTVPDSISRQTAIPAMQGYLRAYPLPNGPEVLTPCTPATDPTCPAAGEKPTGAAEFNASYSNPGTLDAYSLRLDHKITDKWAIFGRYNYSPSKILQRTGGQPYYSLNSVFDSNITTQTATAGATWTISPIITNELRANYSRTSGSNSSYLDNFGGAVPLESLPFPNPYTSQNGSFRFTILGLTNYALQSGLGLHNSQRQINVVDDIAFEKGTHNLKFGLDFRRLSPPYSPALYDQFVWFGDVPSAQQANLEFAETFSSVGATFLFRNLSTFVQDSWRVAPRFTVTYGLRWDLDFSPSTTSGPSLPAVTGYNVNDLSRLTLASPGTSPYKTTYANFAPRIGMAYQVSADQNWGTVARGGFGVFYDLLSSEVGNGVPFDYYPYGSFKFIPGPVFGGLATFPLGSADTARPPIAPPNAANPGDFDSFDPNLKLPYTLEWNLAIEQSLGSQQTLSATYLGSLGKRLIQSGFVYSPNPSIQAVQLVTNAAASNYSALQVQFQRRLSRGLQALVSYTWAHSIDDASAGSAFGNGANALVPGLNPNTNRADSDFDIRNALSVGLTYAIPIRGSNAFTHALLRGWSLQNVFQARSAPPANVFDQSFFKVSGGATNVRPDVTRTIPLYLYGSQYPGGKIFNNTVDPSRPGCLGPFCPPPTDPNSGSPLRQGDLPRNALRGFGTAQWDFAVRRDFPVHDSMMLQFRAEMFNVLNHPSFAPPVADISQSNFGLSNQTLGQYLGGNVGGGGFSPLYQLGGPRSIQLALKLQF